MIVCLFNEMFYSVSVCSPEREDAVYVTFPNERFKKPLAKDFRRLYLVHEYAIFVPMAKIQASSITHGH